MRHRENDTQLKRNDMIYNCPSRHYLYIWIVRNRLPPKYLKHKITQTNTLTSESANKNIYNVKLNVEE